MPRFVILHHEMPPAAGRPTHWDFMLETGGVLRTWALSREPAYDVDISAEALPDHRIDYLDYEGPVSNDRGHVTRWDAGEYRIERQAADGLAVRLDGRRLEGLATIRRLAEQPAQQWSIRFLAEGLE